MDEIANKGKEEKEKEREREREKEKREELRGSRCRVEGLGASGAFEAGLVVYGFIKNHLFKLRDVLFARHARHPSIVVQSNEEEEEEEESFFFSFFHDFITLMKIMVYNIFTCMLCLRMLVRRVLTCDRNNTMHNVCTNSSQSQEVLF